MDRVILSAILLIVVVSLVEIEARGGHREKRRPEILSKNLFHNKHERKQHKRFRNRPLRLNKNDVLKTPKITFTEGMCEPPCKGVEVCVLHYMATDSVCVHRKELKEARHLYRKALRKGRKHHKKHRRGRKGRHNEKMLKHVTRFGDHFNSHLKKFEHHGDLQLHKGPLRKMKRLNLKRTHQKGGEMTLQNAEDLTELMTLGGGNSPAGEISHVERKYPACKNKIEDMKKRLNGWFVELHQIHKETHDHSGMRNPVHFPDFKTIGHCKCAQSVMWNFHNIDKNGDHQMSHEEREHLEKAFQPQEKCVTPAVESCNSDHDSVITKKEWCCCFSHIEAPCFVHLKNRHQNSDGNGYKPSCTSEGYYNKKQCNKRTGHCWCSDLDGNEIRGTRSTGHVTCEEEKGDNHFRRGRRIDIKHVFP